MSKVAPTAATAATTTTTTTAATATTAAIVAVGMRVMLLLGQRSGLSAIGDGASERLGVWIAGIARVVSQIVTFDRTRQPNTHIHSTPEVTKIDSTDRKTKRKKDVSKVKKKPAEIQRIRQIKDLNMCNEK